MEAVLIFIVKLIVISLVTDTWLYWIHRGYHSKYCPKWLKKTHDYHHTEFLKSGAFKLSIIELLIIVSIPATVISLLIHPAFSLVVLAWSWFEAARGHGHYKWFKIIPKWYYRKLKFCGMRYHLYHHTGDSSKNFGQFLKIWDKICGTEYKLNQAFEQRKKEIEYG